MSASSRHLVINVNSRECDPPLLKRLAGAEFFPERSLGWSILRAGREPSRLAAVVVAPDLVDRESVVDYFCALATASRDEARSLRRRVETLIIDDSSPRWLSDKLLDAEDAAARSARQRLRSLVEDCRRAGGTVTVDYFEPSANLERLCRELDAEPTQARSAHIPLGSKTGSRRLFAEVGLAAPRATGLHRGVEDLAEEVAALAAEGGAARFLVKLDSPEFAAGHGSALLDLSDLDAETRSRGEEIARRLPAARLVDGKLGWSGFVAAMAAAGALAEEYLQADESRSPSFQGRIAADGTVSAVSTHEQLFAADGQTYVGCFFPAAAEYRSRLVELGVAVGERLVAHGVEQGAYGVDFLALRDAGAADWKLYGCEVNLRETGTQHGYQTAVALLGEPVDGELSADDGRRVYLCTDGLYDASYRGNLRPGRLIEAVRRRGDLHYDRRRQRGVVLHMLGALHPYGKVGATCIGRDRAEAESLLAGLKALLDELAAAASRREEA